MREIFRFIGLRMIRFVAIRQNNIKGKEGCASIISL